MKAGKGLIPITAGILYFTIFSGLSIGAVLEVGPGKPYATIQSAIDAAVEGDTVLVYPGTYYEAISFRGKDIVLTSTYPENPNAVEETIISGEGSDYSPLVLFSGTETAACVLNGFTITEGGTYEVHYYWPMEVPPYWPGGGGIRGYNTHATIQNCIVSHNFFDMGGGIGECDGLISNCVIHHNTAKGLYWLNDEGPFPPGWYYEDGLGGGLYKCNGVISNCTIVGNLSNDDGGGLYRCNGVISNCTIVGNMSNDDGGGFFDCDGTIRNCIVWGNIAIDDGDQLYSSSMPTYSCVQNLCGGMGNIVNSPLFADAGDDDYHLKSEYGRWEPGNWFDPNTPTDANDDYWVESQWVTDAVTSPCIDAGDPADAGWMEELWPHGKRINMGAYGGTPQASMSPNPIGFLSDVDHNECVGISDLALLCEDWLLDLPLLDTDLDRDNDVDVTDFSLLSAQWGLCGPAVLGVSANLFTFSALEGGDDPNTRILLISNLEGAALHWSIDAPGLPGWLSIDPTGGTLVSGENEPVTLSVDITGLSGGQYSYSFDVIDPAALNSPQTVTVNLHIGTLAAYWALDEETGMTAYDSSGYGHDGTLMNMDPNDWVGGKIGNCLDFDGVDDYVEMTGYPGITGDVDRTTCGWVKTSGTGVILSYGSMDTDMSGKWIMSVVSGKLHVTNWGGNVIGSTTIADGQWHHVAAVLEDLDGDGKKVEDIRLYVDGVEETGVSYGGNGLQDQDPIITISEEPVHLGANDGWSTLGMTNFLSCQLDDVRMYDTALSAEQIAILAGE